MNGSSTANHNGKHTNGKDHGDDGSELSETSDLDGLDDDEDGDTIMNNDNIGSDEEEK